MIDELPVRRIVLDVREPSPEEAEDAAEERRARLYSRGLSKTLATPHRRYVRRLALERALKAYRKTIRPEDR